MASKYVPRVNQLDAIQLDQEISKIFQDQLNNLLVNLPPGLLSKYKPEIDLLIQSSIWYFSIVRSGHSFGQNLLSITYDKDVLTRKKLFLQYVLTILSRYFKDVSSIRFINLESLQNGIRMFDCITRFLFVVNFFRFLKVGKYPTIVDYLLGLQFNSLTGNKMRNVGYNYMTRELMWTGFIELLGVTIPLINYHSIRRKFKNIFKSSKSQEVCRDISFNVDTKCTYCSDRPKLPCHIGCSHVYCYYCLQGNKTADPNFQCTICDYSGDNKVIRIGS